jgi:hypothetical protein
MEESSEFMTTIGVSYRMIDNIDFTYHGKRADFWEAMKTRLGRSSGRESRT